MYTNVNYSTDRHLGCHAVGPPFFWETSYTKSKATYLTCVLQTILISDLSTGETK